MKTRKFFITFVLALLTAAFVEANPIYKVTNVSPNPTLTNEFYLTATNITVNINGSNVRVMVYKDDPPGGGGAPAQIPSPLIELNVGQTVICHFKNLLTNNPEGATIHWHGIELDNDSDGTAVTQDTIFKGQTYTYRFVVDRAALCWYHSHIIPGTTTFGGMYGPIVIHDANETALVAANVLPPTNRTFQLVMSDISFTNGFVGYNFGGTNYSLNQLIQFCENDILGLPNAERAYCGTAGNPGNFFMCNGTVPSRNGNFCTATSNSAPVFFIGKNQRVRLQLFNAAISRNCYLTLKYPCSNPTGNTNLYHIGGQGGLLDSAVLDGGVQSGYNFRYSSGTVNIGSGAREDVMFYSSGNGGDVIQLLGMSPGGSWNLSGFGTNYPVAFFVVTNGGNTNLPLVVGSPILSAAGVTNENLSLLNTNALMAPPVAAWGTQDGRVSFENGTPSNGVNSGPNIGGYSATPLDGNSGYGAWPGVPHPPTALWARAGSVLQLAIANDTGGASGGNGVSVHPFHLHGFAMQPVAIYSANLQTNLFTFPYRQFVDTIDVLPGEALVFRIKLSDRPILADSATGGPVTTAVDAALGGNLGRWLMHCHIFMHGAVGMISEMVVQSSNYRRLTGPKASTNSILFTGGSTVPWDVVTNVPWLHAAAGYASGTGNDTILFNIDENTGPTRSGKLDINGLTVDVTQAGTNYIQAPGPSIGLVTTNINSPFGIGLDDDGNVFFTDSANGAVKKWTKSSNTVSSFLSGLSTPYGLGLDRLGNVYVAQFGSAVIKKRFAPNPPVVVNLFTNTSSGVAGLTVDEGGNVYIADPSEHAVKKWTVGTGVLSSYTTNGLISPWGVAVDKAGGIYASDIGDNSVKKLGIRFISFFPLFVIPYWNTFTTISNLSNPYSLTVDDGGNIFVGDYSHGAIKKFTMASNTVSTVISGLNSPIGVAMDPVGNLFFCDWGGDAVRELPYAYVDPSPQFQSAELNIDTLPGVLLPDANLQAPFLPTMNAPWILYGGSTTGQVLYAVLPNTGAPRSGSITLLGTNITINQAGSYFALGTTNLLVGPQPGTNSINAALVPASSNWVATTATPWLHFPTTSGSGSGNILFNFDLNLSVTRTGALTINGKVVQVTQAGSSYVQAPGPLTSLVSTGLAQPWGVVADPLGNVIFTDSSHSAIKKWSPVLNTVSSLMSTGLVSPASVDIDAGGNIYVADSSIRAIKKRRVSDGSLLTVADDWPNTPTGIAVDIASNVFWAGPSDDAVKRLFSAGGDVANVVNTNLVGPYGIGVDVASSVYIADAFGRAIKKWNPVSASLTTIGTNGIGTPWDVALDGSGNIYVANGLSNNVVRWNAASQRFNTLVPSGILNIPTGIAVDAAQNIFISDFGSNIIYELPYAFVDATPRSEPYTAGSDSIPPVLPANQNLAPPFAPSVSDPWLNITGVTGGVVSFNFTANTNTVARAAYITVLGQPIYIFQDAPPPIPVFTAIDLLTNGVFQLSFTNGTRAGTYSVLSTTNLLVPLTNWPVIGTATNNGAGVWQFTDFNASNATRFYRIRWP